MTNGYPAPRPLTRSLEPLDGESLAGYLLRLSFRLRVNPLRLAHLTGCAGGTPTTITRRRMLDLDVQRFARATRLSDDEARALTIASWSDRYPPVTRSRIGQGPPVILDNWLFANGSRYCPCCLAGDDSTVQQQYGGPWQKTWQLSVAFACTRHRRLLREACPAGHPRQPGIGTLIDFPGAIALHPAQCRAPRQPGSTSRNRPSCGTRLDQHDDDDLSPGPAALAAQQRILTLLSPQHPAVDASRTFTDLRLATALICMSWPHSFGPDLARWLGDHGTREFTAALISLAAQLDETPCLVNYRRRRQAMQAWCLAPDTWQEITSRLPPVPGPVQPVLDDRKRQEASAFTWAYVTQGEPWFAPRPIETAHPEPVRRDWAVHRANTWGKIARPGRIVHYTELRKLLIEQGDRLVKDIDYNAPPVLSQAR